MGHLRSRVPAHDLRLASPKLSVEEAMRRIYGRPDMQAYTLFINAREFGAKKTAKAFKVKPQTVYDAVHAVKTLLEEEVRQLTRELW